MTLLSAIFLIALPVAAQSAGPDSATIAGITARGRLLAEYDRASARATDAVLAGWQNPTGVEGFVALKGGDDPWRVAFGRLNAAQDTLYVAARAEQGEDPDSFTVTRPTTPAVGSEAERLAFVAMGTAARALAAAGPPPFNGQYNPYLLPQSDGTWYVYFLPGQRQRGIYPHGGDFRYHLSADGRTILETHRMHQTVLMSRLPSDAVSGWHTVVTEDWPQDSDVFLVLTRTPRKPEVVATASYTWEIRVDGTIGWTAGIGKDQK
jgi:hypothetical protein